MGRLETFIAGRYLRSPHRPRFLSLLTGMSLAGMAVSVFAMILVLSVMNGFEADFEKKVVGFKSPLVATGVANLPWKSLAGRLRKADPRIESVDPFIEGEAVLETGSGEVLGVRLRGIDRPPSPEKFQEIDFSGQLQDGEALLGRELSYTTGLSPKVELIFPLGEIGPTGEMLPRTRSYDVIGTFRSGFYEYDTKYLIVSTDEARRLLGDYGRFGLEIWMPPASLESVQVNLASEDWQGLTFQSWRDQNPKLFAALKLERLGMLFLLSLLLMIASFTIFSLMSLTVVEKVRDMAILRTAGLSVRRVIKIFLMQAAAIGLLGDLIGGLLGTALVQFFIRFPIRLPSAYYVQHLPLKMDPGITTFVLILSPCLALLAALYPALRAGRGSLTEILRYE